MYVPCTVKTYRVPSFYFDNTKSIQNQYKIHLATDQHSKVCRRYRFTHDTGLKIRTESQRFEIVIVHFLQIITNFSLSFPVYTYSDFSNHYGIINTTKPTHNLSKRTQNSIHL